MEDFQDVDYHGVNETEKEIRGKVLFYSTSQVATLLGETDSKIRYYTSVFNDTLDIQFSNKQRRYKDEDIKKLKYILELKQEGLTLKQIAEYISEVSLEEGEGIQIKESNPLSIKAIAITLLEEQHTQFLELKKEMKEEQHNQLIEIKEELISTLKENYEGLKDNIIEQIATNIDDIIGNKLNEVVEGQAKIKEHDIELVGLLKEQMEERKADFFQIKLLNEQQNKSFWKKLVELFSK
ncbi:helix-turn-helix domain-containing protein [Clostridium tagluense]|uniref:HTH merR-type domain-containing protein n=1 Tax=Clostridium tagluense TaxID=360422 RepID=A0A401USU8_9CLOT|nr:helix-turn-helix domain-containing protein [Clostridium tagluense]GCD12584.1 hypothetical protein Ctaglu_42070 [Clostridium tagluense]